MHLTSVNKVPKMIKNNLNSPALFTNQSAIKFHSYKAMKFDIVHKIGYIPMKFGQYLSFNRLKSDFHYWHLEISNSQII